MKTILIILFVTYCATVLVVGLLRAGEAIDWAVRCGEWNVMDKIYFVTPKGIKKYCKMNWFGAVAVFIMWRLISPITGIVQLIDWLFHIGGEEETH